MNASVYLHSPTHHYIYTCIIQTGIDQGFLIPRSSNLSRTLNTQGLFTGDDVGAATYIN